VTIIGLSIYFVDNIKYGETLVLLVCATVPIYLVTTVSLVFEFGWFDKLNDAIRKMLLEKSMLLKK